MIRCLFILALMACGPNLGHAETVQDGRAACRGFMDGGGSMTTNVELISAGRCTGMVDGITRLMVINCAFAQAHPAIPRAEAPYTTGAAIQVFLNWADDHPERWGDDFADGVMKAIQETFPCQR